MIRRMLRSPSCLVADAPRSAARYCLARHAERFFVAAAEVAEVQEPASERDLRDAVAGAQRIGEIAPALFQPPHPDPIDDSAGSVES